MISKNPLPKVITALLTLGAGLALAEEPKGGYEWMPAAAEASGIAAAEGTSTQLILPVKETATPKATADIAKFTREYTLDLKKFGIHNDGTHPEETSKGINAALQDAKAAGANRIIFPQGTYLISEKDPIILDHQETIVDLNGATLKMNPNGLPDYTMVNITDEARNFRLTNGTLLGDRYEHDYKTIKSSHEHCRLLRFAGGRELEIDHLTIVDAPGFAVTTNPGGGKPGRAGLLEMIAHWVSFKDIESGAFSDDGQPVENPDKTRTSKAYDLAKCKGQFEFGWTEGYMGFPFIKDRNYQAVFFDAEMKFLEKKQCIQFKKVLVPEGAKYVKLEFNQPEVSNETNHPGTGKARHCGRITNFRPPQDIHFHHNVLRNNRALGMAFTGGIQWVIEDNRFEKNGGQAPSYGIDFEDGWELMQHVVFRRNIFRDNVNDLVVCAGTELIFEDNDFQKAVVFHGRTFNYTVRNNRFVGGRVSYSTRSGAAKIHNNHYQGCKTIQISFNRKGVADGFLRLPGKSVATPALELKNERLEDIGKVTGTYLKFVDSTLDRVKLVAGPQTMLASFENCEFKDTSLNYEADGPPVWFLLEKAKGELLEEGPGLVRKKESPKIADHQ